MINLTNIIHKVKHVTTSPHIPRPYRDNNTPIHALRLARLAKQQTTAIGIGRETRLIRVTSGIGHVTRKESQHKDSNKE